MERASYRGAPRFGQIPLGAQPSEVVMSSQPTTQLLRSAPYFPVADLEQSAAHYERVLGFRLEYTGGKPPEFAILSRDGLSIMLRLVPSAERIVPNEKQGGTWDVFFWVRDAQALHAELRANGADIVYGPVMQPHYRMEEFAVRDREGYVLGFGQPIA
jgi:catechol 2,3-dioxygenase-like lactoylglutathione lyase family enzyme